jgi:hypothetical protein
MTPRWAGRCGYPVTAPGIGNLSTADLTDLLTGLWAGPPAGVHGYRPLALTDNDQPQLSGVINPFWDVARWIPCRDEAGQVQPTLDLDLRLLQEAGLSTRFPSSRELRRRYGYAVISPGDVSWLAGVLAGRDVLEIGAGNAYLSWQLRQAGSRLVATDVGEDGSRGKWCLGPEFTDVLERDAAEAVLAFPDHVLITCWPAPRSGYTADAVRRYRGDTLVYCGSQHDGYTDAGLLRELAANWELTDRSSSHVSWARAVDHLGVYNRK